MSYNTTKFRDQRSKSLYDHFEISRLANFEEIKSAKNLYLQRMQDLNDPDYDGDKSVLVNYTMTEQEVKDSFNVLTNHQLKEAYDKHNLFYSEEDFLKKKQKSISTVEKYMLTVKGCMSFGPFYGIIQMVLGGDHQTTGRQMAITGVLICTYICYEIKKPAETGGVENWAVELINEHHMNETLIQILGPEVKHYTVYQFTKYLHGVIWQSFFQFSIAMSKLLDKNPDTHIDMNISKVGQKNMKSLHIFEYMQPRRSIEVMRKELSKEIMAIRDQREKLEKDKLVLAEKIKNGEIDASTTIESYSSKLRECNQGHKLVLLEKKPFKYPSVVCDRCKAKIQPKGEKFWHGEESSYDVCIKCMPLDDEVSNAIENKEDKEEVEKEETKELEKEEKLEQVEKEKEILEKVSKAPMIGLSEEEINKQESLRQISNVLKALTAEQVSLKEAELLRREKELDEREAALKVREQELEERLKEEKENKNLSKDQILAIPDTDKTIEQLVFAEAQNKFDAFNKRTPKPPPVFLLKEIKDISWTKIVEGSYRYALNIRKDGHLGRMKRIQERQKEKAAKKGRARTIFGKIWTFIGYLVVICVVLSFIGPMIAMNYIRSQIKTGEWGEDFVAEEYINKYNYTAPVEQKEEDEDFGDNADGSWEADKDEQQKDEQKQSEEDGQKEEL